MLTLPIAQLFSRTSVLTLLLASVVACGSAQDEEPTARSAASAQPATTNSTPTYSAKVFYNTTSIGLPRSGGYAFSPDGHSLLISSDESGVFNAYRLDIHGKKSTPVTSSTDNSTFAVSTFPDDERVLYTQDNGGNELNHVWVSGPDGSSTDLTPGEELKATFIGWLADGSHFYLATTQRNGSDFDLYRYSAKDYSNTRVFDNPGLGLAGLSRDGRWLALTKPNSSADQDIFVVDLHAEDPQPLLVTAHQGDVEHNVFAFTPDNSQLIYGTDEHGEFTSAWSYRLSDGHREPFLEADWNIIYVSYSPSGKYMVYGINADASVQVQVTDTQSGNAVRLPDLPQGELRSLRFAPDEKHIGLIVNAPNSPSNIYIIDIPKAHAHRLTNTLNPSIDPNALVVSEVVRYKSFDGLEIPSILYKPKNASAQNPVPALVFVHGGPGGQTRTGYSATIQHLVNNGYAVLGANNRGSSGYGKTFYHLDDKRHGEEDLLDIVHGGKYLAGLDWVDAESVGVMGGSYGGYMTAAALAFHPDAFAVGVDLFGVTNWSRTLTNIPPWWEAFKKSLYDEMGDPATDAERHRRISPLFHASNITKPTLVVQGANDPRVLKVESDELVAAIQANEVPVEYIVFDDEGHGFTKRENRIVASDAYLAFLDKYLKK